MTIDIDGHREGRTFCYIVPKIASDDMILGMPWVTKQDVRINGPESECIIRSTNTLVRNRARVTDPTIDCIAVSAVSLNRLVGRKKTKGEVEVLAASMADIQKALTPRKKTDPRTKLPSHYHEFLDMFNANKAEKLPPVRGQGIDHAIKIEKKDGMEQRVPWGPLYNMSREELLVLRTTLMKFLDKGFIRVSNSPAAAPVLFV